MAHPGARRLRQAPWLPPPPPPAPTAAAATAPAPARRVRRRGTGALLQDERRRLARIEQNLLLSATRRGNVRGSSLPPPGTQQKGWRPRPPPGTQEETRNPRPPTPPPPSHNHPGNQEDGGRPHHHKRLHLVSCSVCVVVIQ